MNLQEQEQQFKNLVSQFEELNKIFDNIMKENNFTNEDLKIDENALSPEVRAEWQKMKNDIENTVKANTHAKTPAQSITAGKSRRNTIRL